MKKSILIFFVSFFISQHIQAQDYWLEYTQFSCEWEVEICVAPSTQEISMIDWVIGDLTNPILTYSDSMANCFYFALGPGSYDVYAFLYDLNGNLIPHSSADGTTVEFLFTQVFIFDGVEIELNSNASTFCPEGNGSGGCDKVCENTTVTYWVTEFGNPGQNSFQWSVTGEASWTEISFKEIEVVWGEAGTGQVTVWGIDEFGCEGQATKCIEILAAPEASFETSPSAVNDLLTICQGQEVFFQNTTAGGIYYEWNFGDGNSTTEANPEHIFNNAGSFEVELIAKNECLCSDTTSLLVEVEPLQSPFIACVGTICELDTFHYESDADCTDFFWTVSSNGVIVNGGGVNDDYIEVEWNGGPIGEIELSVANCNGNYCLAPAMAQIPIISGNAEIIGKANVCKGAIETYTIQDYSATYYNWSITSGQIITGQGTNEVTVEWNSPGNLPATAQISVAYENCYLECGGNDEMDVRIVDEFLAAGPIEVCPEAIEEYTTIKLSGVGKVMSNWTLKDNANAIVWSFANAETVNVPFPALAGTYMLTVEPVNANDYCNDKVDMILTVVDRPAPPLSIDGELAICPGASYQYTANSSSTNATMTWSINDGGIITEQSGNPITVKWTSAGPYEIGVSQILNDRLPCPSEFITQVPIAITLVSLTGNDIVCHEDIQSYTADFIENATYNWEIIPAEMGTITSDPNKNEIDVQWNKIGNAELRVSLCGFSEKIDIEINPLPQPTANHPFELCANEQASVSVNGTFVNYDWYDDAHNVVATGATPDLFPGSYEVIVTDDKGCTGNTYFTIEGLPVPNIRISTPEANVICLAAGQTFPLLYGLDSDYGFTWQWFKDGTAIAGETNATYQTSDEGDYQVEVTDIKGCKNKSNVIIVRDSCGSGNPGSDPSCTNPAGSADFSAAQGAYCNEFNFTNLSTNIIPGSLKWNFGDEAVTTDFSTLDNPSYTFSNAGFYKVLFLARVEDLDNPGSVCGVWSRKVIEVPAAAKFDIDNACPGNAMKFYDLSTFIPGEDVISWSWNFGDPGSGANNSSILQEPDHIYNLPGTYTVSLEIATATCTSIYSREVTVQPLPELMIPQPDVSCANTAIRFEGIELNENIVSYEWDFGDPSSGDKNTSTAQLTFHEYATPGLYVITLNAINIYGCDDSFILNVDIENNDLNGQITSDNLNPMCDGETAMLTSPTGGVEWLWSNDETTESIAITAADVYGLTVTDINGCTYSPDLYEQILLPKPVSTIRAIDVNEFGQPLQYYYERLEVCEGDDAYLEIIEKEDHSYQWSSGEVDSEVSFTFERGNLLSVGTHNFTVTLTNDLTGCTNEIGPFEVVVNPVPDNVVITSNPTGYLCGGSNTTLEVDSPNPDYTYYWSSGDIGTSTDVYMAGIYYVKAVNQFGCSAESNTIEINKGPDIGLIPDGCLEKCGPDTLCLPQIPNIDTYQWYFNNVAIPAPEGTTADFIAAQSGTYHVELTDVFGCTAVSDEFTLELIDPTGTLSGLVYFDVNENGIIDGTDTLMQDVQILITGSGGYMDSLITDINGSVEFVGIPSENYQISIDSTTTPGQTLLYDDILNVQLLGCDSEGTFEFLAYKNCTVLTSIEDVEYCHGTNDYNGIQIENDTSFVVTLTSFDGCDSLVTVNAVVYDEISFDLAAEKICWNATDGLISVNNVQGGKGILEYSMDGINYSATPSFSNLNANQFVVYVRDELDCIVSQMVEVEQEDEIVESLDLEYCAGTNLYAGIEIKKDTSFTVVLTSAAGCDSTLNVSAKVYPELQLDLSSIKSCWNNASGEVTIDLASGGKGALEYAINGGSFGTDQVFTNLAADDYTVVVKDELGCETMETIIVEETEAIQYTVDIPILECEEDFDYIELDVLSPDVTIEWEDASTNANLEVSEVGNYSVELSNQCEVINEQFAVNAEVLKTNGLYVPNIFSPNGDGANDEFKILTNPDAKFLEADLMILDRWGEKVYASDDPTIPWDGMLTNKTLQPGVYVVMFKGVLDFCHEEKAHELHKSVTIVK